MKYFKIILSVILLLSVISGIYITNLVFFPIDSYHEDKVIIIPSDSDLHDVYKILDSTGIEMNRSLFSFISDRMNYTGNILGGRYEISEGKSLVAIIRKLRSGVQEPVEVTIYRENTRSALAAKIAQYLEYDSSYFADVFMNDSILHTLQMDSTSFMAYIIPNTYFMHYNTSPLEVLKRFKTEHRKFWSENGRREKAKAISMTPLEVYTLASIIERETQYKPERPKMAGVYLNRLNRGIPLQADPTILYAMGWPEAVDRVLNKDLKINSPYNTYLHAGLPPGPIGTATISSIDAVLNAEKHNYLYFCARPDLSGRHVYARTLSQHINNANKFQHWLNRRGIYR